MKAKETLICHARRDHNGAVRHFLTSGDMTEYGYIKLGPVEVEYEVPETDMVAAEIAGLEVIKAKVVEETQRKLGAIEDQLSKLRCLTYEGA